MFFVSVGCSSPGMELLRFHYFSQNYCLYLGLGKKERLNIMINA